MPPPPQIFTIGHSNHPLEHFLGLLRTHAIQVLVDVRSSPYCGYSIHFNREALQASLTAAGVRYLYLGAELGGQPAEERFYDDAGYILYWKIAQSPAFAEGLARLRKGMEGYRIAVMCSEEDPSVCHRRLLIARVLHETGVAVAHLRGDGRLETEAALRAAEARPRTEQLTLFEEDQPAEPKPWRSLRSGLRKPAPQIFSDDSGEPA